MARSLLLGLSPGAVVRLRCTRTTRGKVCQNVILPEQRSIEYHDPAQLPPARIPDNVAAAHRLRPAARDAPSGSCRWTRPSRIALENARVIRVLAGTTATSSGQTIYDAAITNTTIDQAQARFDPTLTQNNTWSRTNTPFAVPRPARPDALRHQQYADGRLPEHLGLTKTNVLGGQWALTGPRTRRASPPPAPSRSTRRLPPP